MNYDAVSFPNLGIGQIKVSPVALNIGDSISIKWYAVIICIGILVAAFVCSKLCKRFAVKADDFMDCLLYSLPVGFIGARLTYVLGDLDSFHSFMDVIAVWNGGLAIYGGVIFAALSVYTVCRIKKADWRSMLDIMAVGFLIGQMIGRFGNFINIEVYGIETNLPWAMGIGWFGEGADKLVHPLFLYEILWNLIGFVLIYGYLNLRKFKGEVFLWYLAWYGLGRGLMEPLRDPEYNLHLFGIRIMMVLAFSLCAAAVVATVIIRRRSPGLIETEPLPDSQPSEPDYEKQFNINPDDIEMTEEEYKAKTLYDAIDEKTGSEDENATDSNESKDN